MRRALRRGPLQLVTALAIFAVGGAAFTAANTVPQTSAGEGANTISGFTITNVAYTLNGTNPTNIDLITFTATAVNGDAVNTALTTYIEADNGSGVWYTCARIAGVAPAHDLSCNTTVGTQLTVPNADNLTVIIAEQ